MSPKRNQKFESCHNYHDVREKSSRDSHQIKCLFRGMNCLLRHIAWMRRQIISLERHLICLVRQIRAVAGTRPLEVQQSNSKTTRPALFHINIILLILFIFFSVLGFFPTKMNKLVSLLLFGVCKYHNNIMTLYQQPRTGFVLYYHFVESRASTFLY
jgi:hypothetical protein